MFAFHPPWSSIYVRHFAGSTRLSKSAPHLLTVQPAQLDCDHALEACTLRATATTETRRAFGIDGGHALRLDRSGAIFPAPPSRAVRWRPLTPAVPAPRSRATTKPSRVPLDAASPPHRGSVGATAEVGQSVASKPVKSLVVSTSYEISKKVVSFAFVPFIIGFVMQTKQTTAGRQGQRPADERGGRCEASMDTLTIPTSPSAGQAAMRTDQGKSAWHRA